MYQSSSPSFANPLLPVKSKASLGDDVEQLPVDKIALLLPGFVILAGKYLGKHLGKYCVCDFL